MPSPLRIHTVGASASGTTTLAVALAERLGCPHFDTDSYYWAPTDPPFTTKRPPDERLRLMSADLDTSQSWLLSGSLMGWGDALVPRFTHVVFVHLPEEVRMARLMRRERERYGADVEPGGRMHEQHKEFVAWAERYEDPTFFGRSLALHRAWLGGLDCPVIEISGTPTVEEGVAMVMASL